MAKHKKLPDDVFGDSPLRSTVSSREATVTATETMEPEGEGAPKPRKAPKPAPDLGPATEESEKVTIYLTHQQKMAIEDEVYRRKRARLPGAKFQDVVREIFEAWRPPA